MVGVGVIDGVAVGEGVSVGVGVGVCVGVAVAVGVGVAGAISPTADWQASKPSETARVGATRRERGEVAAEVGTDFGSSQSGTF